MTIAEEINSENLHDPIVLLFNGSGGYGDGLSRGDVHAVSGIVAESR